MAGGTEHGLGQLEPRHPRKASGRELSCADLKLDKQRCGGQSAEEGEAQGTASGRVALDPQGGSGILAAESSQPSPAGPAGSPAPCATPPSCPFPRLPMRRQARRKPISPGCSGARAARALGGIRSNQQLGVTWATAAGGRPYWLQRTSAPSDWPMHWRARCPGRARRQSLAPPALWPRLQSGRNHGGVPSRGLGRRKARRKGQRRPLGVLLGSRRPRSVRTRIRTPTRRPEGAYWQGGGQAGAVWGGDPGRQERTPPWGGGRLWPCAFPHHAPGGISPILRTGFQNEAKRQTPHHQTV